MEKTIIQDMGVYQNNHLFIKREDMIPFSFGGNKARKAYLFFQEIEKGEYDCVVTYGTSSSNHCRIIANACYRRRIPCYIISPQEASEPTFNSQLVEMFDVHTTIVPVDTVHDTIEKKIVELKNYGRKPYFIEGGGHGNIGTEAYVHCYEEISKQEKELGVYFDYIFLASGTGTTHAGLVCGQLLSGDERKIRGISIARKNPRGRNIVVDSIRSYIGDKATEKQIQESTVFIDDYTNGYGKDDRRVLNTIKDVMKNYGIPLDTTYTGKAFMGMQEYIKSADIKGKNILFIHTGGTPLFFDTLKKQSEGI